MDLLVWVLHPHTHAHKRVGSRSLPINKLIDREIDSYFYPNKVKIHWFRVLNAHCYPDFQQGKRVNAGDQRLNGARIQFFLCYIEGPALQNLIET